MMKHGIAFTLCLITLVAASASLRAQDDSSRVIYYVGKNVRSHPDGAIGTISFHGLITYGAVTKGYSSGPDIQKYDFGLSWVAGPKVSFTAKFLTIDEDSLRYETTAAFTLFTRDPTQKAFQKNPDGCIGVPAITLGAGFRYPDLGMDQSFAVADFAVALPVSHRFTMLAGYRYFEEIETFDAQSYYGGVSLYLAEYSADSAYNNPDGPIGVLALSLTGGGSSNGVFGQASLLFPISANLTWKLLIRGERIAEPYRRVPTFGAGLSLYPGN